MEDRLRQIQLCQLDIMIEVARICEENDLRYYLAWGTMLGAVRHKGFIPWDDDLDIYMPIDDFRKFENICRSELGKSYFLQSPRTEPFLGTLFFKVRKNGTYMRETKMEDNVFIKHQGVWIDIFPLINFSNNENVRICQLKVLNELQYIRFQYADYNGPID